MLLPNCLVLTQKRKKHSLEISLFLPPATKLRQGSVCTPVGHSVHGGVCHTPLADTPLGRHCPSRHPPGQTPSPLRSACWEIRSTSGRYASYWNAFLLSKDISRVSPVTSQLFHPSYRQNPLTPVRRKSLQSTKGFGPISITFQNNFIRL